ncbi:hypothetical protein EYF80_056968 [Liparis tanakae]|uniref:Secreted protein n=1 Tax=Liparis tanakae TaxID=230148 RepID=A0A4Z2EVN0_9TELE|nr:hypothetical protein EYF80_056968 [Liparis tanakae]
MSCSSCCVGVSMGALASITVCTALAQRAASLCSLQYRRSVIQWCISSGVSAVQCSTRFAVIITKEFGLRGGAEVITSTPSPRVLCGGTHHGVLGVGLLVVHLPDLLLRGAVDLTQHAEPLAVDRRVKASHRLHTLRTSWF